MPKPDDLWPFDQNNSSSCLDSESGLFHPEHFRILLSHEMLRQDHWERPLGLVVIRFQKEISSCLWVSLCELLKENLKGLDMAARLEEKLLAILLPDSRAPRVAKLLEKIIGGLEKNPSLCDLTPLIGVALTRPGEGREAGDILSQALDKLDLPDRVVMTLNQGEILSDESILLRAEKDLLFAGFSFLTRDLAAGDASD